MSLIITCQRNLEKKAAEEIFEFVKEIGSIKPYIIDINLPGIFMIDTDIDPDEFIEKLFQCRWDVKSDMARKDGLIPRRSCNVKNSLKTFC